MTSNKAYDAAIAEGIIGLAMKAGSKILEIYATDFQIDRKDDASPVTEADRAGEEIILSGLKEIAPDIPILAEEQASKGCIPTLGDQFFLVDPLDGTKEFINRTGEFTVNIALIRSGRPVVGVVYAPAINRLYAGDVAQGAWACEVSDEGVLGARHTIIASPTPKEGLIAVASRSHRSPETDAFLETLDIADFEAAGSSLKFCLVAEGKAHIYPRFGRTMEWDTGAGQAVLEAAGGAVIVYPGGEHLRYAKSERGFDNPHFIAWGRRTE
ncbi:MAG: 3'(2'),5'-bisphosphate nucleotidase CysQ [Pseudomonadota bacterium]